MEGIELTVQRPMACMVCRCIMGINMKTTPPSPTEQLLPVSPARLRRKRSLVVGCQHDMAMQEKLLDREKIHLLNSPFVQVTGEI